MSFVKPLKLTKNKSQKFPALSLKTSSQERSGEIQKQSCNNNATKRTHTTELSKCDKKIKLEEDLLDDALFDNLNLTQMLDSIPSCSKKSLRSNSENCVQQKSVNKILPNYKSEGFFCSKSKSLDRTSSKKEGTVTNLSHLFNTQDVYELEAVLIDNTQKLNKIESKSVSDLNKNKRNILEKVRSENLGDILSDANRLKVETFFDEIEHSVSILGTDEENIDENVSKILEQLFPSQTNNQTPNESQSANRTNGSQNLGISQINASFASALKQVFLNNISKAKSPVKRASRSIIPDENRQFTEAGPFYGLPVKVKELFILYRGIEKLYEWQEECLELPAIKERKNLIYALPTSGGKTLVAEILMLREVICYKRNAIFILPYVAIVQEKVWALSPFAVALDFLIEEYAASKGAYPPRKRRRKNSIYIATIEKALGLLNSLIETDRLKEIGLIVVDELHLVGEQGRGATLEALLAKIMYIKADIQIVGMSATIGNVNEVCTFLNADIYTQNFRPVELVEYVKCGTQIAKIDYSKAKDLLTVERVLDDKKYAANNIDPDKLGPLVMEVVPEGSCLIFCASKKNCENVAYLLCRVLDKKLLEYKKTEKEHVKHSLKDEGGALCKIFNVSIQYGVAYHHSGLTNEERRVIEDSFRAGILSVICCTSTLAAGVNLPAKRVILRQPYIGRDFITLSKYKQMVGRAGRTGFGETGDSIMICTSSDLPKVEKLLREPMDEALSSMHENDGKGLQQLLLSCISLGIATTRHKLQEVAKKTLLFIQSERLNVNVKKLTDKAIADLFKLGALQEADLKKPENNVNCDVTVRMETSLSSNASFCETEPQQNKKRKIVIKSDTKIVISKLGCAAVKGNFELSRAHLLYDDLYDAQKSLVLLNNLHLLFLVTPYEIADQIKPNRNDYYTIYSRLEKHEAITARTLGITEAVAIKLMTNQPIKNVPERILNRFYLTLMLYDLWNEKPVFEVSEKFQINRGIVQHLMTGAASFASNVVRFCEEFEEFWTFASLLKGIGQRLSHCCVRELLPLMELPAVKQSRARQLYNAGFKNIRSIAAANVESLMENIEHMPRRVAKQLIAAAKMLLLEKVENLREEAEDVLEGVENPQPFLNNSILN